MGNFQEIAHINENLCKIAVWNITYCSIVNVHIFFHNVLYIDSSVKNTGRLLPSKNDGTIRFS